MWFKTWKSNSLVLERRLRPCLLIANGAILTARLGELIINPMPGPSGQVIAAWLMIAWSGYDLARKCRDHSRAGKNS